MTSPRFSSFSAKSRNVLGAVIALRERRVELQQRALEQSELRRHFAIGQHLQRALDERQRLIERLRAPPALPGAAAVRARDAPPPLPATFS